MKDNPDTPSRLLAEAHERVEQLKRAEDDPKYLGELTPRTDTELDTLREAVRRQPTDSAAHAALGHALLSRQDYDGARGCYREAQRLGTRDAKVYLHLGNCLYRQSGANSCAAVRDAWASAVRLDPNCAEAHINLGHAL